ncbi:MAG: response regulator [Myxococcales bacterium]|nr:response regulator [Myxococcota bacterium]MDW8283568.1 response regulator [Myxococcales bacterium]
MESAVYEETQETPRILVVDDEQVIRDILTDFLTLEGYSVRAVEDGAAALEELRRRSYNLVLSDLKMPRMGGIELLAHIAEAKLNVATIIMTGFGTVETAIDAMKRGAYDYILKPFKVEEVVRVVQRGLERQRLLQENFRLKEAVTLYKLSEAMAQSLSLDTILDLILEATLQDADADVATLMLKDPKTGEFCERTRKYADTVRGDVAFDGSGIGELNVKEILAQHQQDRPLLCHGIRALRYFATAPKEKRLVSFCSIPLKVQDRVIGMLNAYSYTRGRKFSEGQRRLLSVLASRAAVSIENAQLYQDLVLRNLDLSRANASLQENFRATIVGFAHALEESDRYTRGHSERVSQYARIIGQGVGLSEREMECLMWAGLMHDIGKIGIRYEKLNKPGKLTPEEVAMFRTHPAKGKRILEPIPFMAELIPGAFCHHENWDGSGYPQGLMSDRIPLIGRIVAIADTYDAMTSDRSYRKAMRHEVAVAEIERCAGSQFDGELVEVFLRCIEEWRQKERAAGREVVK